jgi:hypothetical protein
LSGGYIDHQGFFTPYTSFNKQPGEIAFGKEGGRAVPPRALLLEGADAGTGAEEERSKDEKRERVSERERRRETRSRRKLFA